MSVTLILCPTTESSLLTEAPPTPSMFKYRLAYNSPGRNHSAISHSNKVHWKTNSFTSLLTCLSGCNYWGKRLNSYAANGFALIFLFYFFN